MSRMINKNIGTLIVFYFAAHLGLILIHPILLHAKEPTPPSAGDIFYEYLRHGKIDAYRIGSQKIMRVIWQNQQCTKITGYFKNALLYHANVDASFIENISDKTQIEILPEKYCQPFIIAEKIRNAMPYHNCSFDKDSFGEQWQSQDTAGSTSGSWFVILDAKTCLCRVRLFKDLHVTRNNIYQERISSHFDTDWHCLELFPLKYQALIKGIINESTAVQLED